MPCPYALAKRWLLDHTFLDSLPELSEAPCLELRLGKREIERESVQHLDVRNGLDLSQSWSVSELL